MQPAITMATAGHVHDETWPWERMVGAEVVEPSQSALLHGSTWKGPRKEALLSLGDFCGRWDLNIQEREEQGLGLSPSSILWALQWLLASPPIFLVLC